MADRTVTVNLRANVRDYEPSVNRAANATDRLNRKASEFDGRKITARADLNDRTALGRLKLLNGELDSLDTRNATPGAELRIARFRVEAAKIEAELHELSMTDATPEVVLRVDEQSAKLAVLREELRRFDGKTFRANAKVDTGNSVRDVNLLASGVMALGPAAIGAGISGGAAIVGLTSTVTLAGAGAAVTLAAFKGMGDAIKAASAYAISPTAENLKKMNAELGKLDAVSADFTRTVGSMAPLLKQLQATSRAGMFPGLSDGLRSLVTLMPEVNNLTRTTSEAIGELGRQGGKALTDPFWRNYIDFLAGEAKPQIIGIGQAIGNFTKGLAGMQMAFSPFARDIIDGLQRMSAEFAEWGANLGKDADFQDFLNYVRDVGPDVVSAVGSIARAVGSLVAAGAPLAPFILGTIQILGDLISTVAGIPVVGTSLVGLAVAFGVVSVASKALQASGIVRGAAMLGMLGPAARSATGGFTGLGAAGAAASGGVGKAGTAAEGAGTRFGALGRVGGAVARNLPIIGAVAIGLAQAYDEMNLSASEGAEGLQATGDAAISARAELRKNDETQRQYTASMGQNMGAIREWIAGMLGTETTTKQATAALNEQLATMTPLQAATVRAQVAQGNYDDTVVRFGQNSPQAVQAMNALRGAQADVAAQTELANLSGAEYFQTLSQLAQGAGPVADAATRIAAGLDMAGVSALGASVDIDNTGRAIATLPNGKQIRVNADTGDAAVQIQTVATNVDKLPPGKTVNVGVIGQPAIDTLRQIDGVKVEVLKDGTVNVTAETSAAKATILAFGQYANAVKANPKISADPALAYSTMLGFINSANAAVGLPQIAANTAQGDAIVNGAIARYNGMTAMPGFDVNTLLGDNRVNDFRARQEGGPPIFALFDANTAPADVSAAGWAGRTQGLNPVPAVNANTGPAMNMTNGWVGYTAGQQPVPNVAANTSPADAASRGWGDRTQGINPRPNVDANTAPADGQISALRSAWNGVTWFVNVVARKLGFAEGGIATPMAQGGVVRSPSVVANEAGNSLSPYNRTYAGKKLRNMPSGGARMVPANSWRVVGDRMDVPELYAPLDGSGRSLALIAQGAASFGKTLVDASAIYGKTQRELTPIRNSDVQRVPQSELRAMASVDNSSRTVNNTVNVSNPVAERASDSVQSRLSRLADLGLFGDDD